MRSIFSGLALVAIGLVPAQAQELSGTLKHIAETGTFTIGYRAAEPPMSFTNEKGEPVGYSIDLCRHIAAAVEQQLDNTELSIAFVPVTAETRFSALQTGEIDILCGATTKTLTRAETVGFTQLTFVTGGSLLSLADSGINTVSNLNGKRAAVVANTTTIEALERVVKADFIDAEIVAVESAAVAMAMLDAGEVDAFASDQVVLIGQVLARPSEQEYLLSQQLISFEPFALAVARGDADFQLVADRALSQLNRSGRILDIYMNWFSGFAEKPPAALQALYRLNATPE